MRSILKLSLFLFECVFVLDDSVWHLVLFFLFGHKVVDVDTLFGSFCLHFKMVNINILIIEHKFRFNLAYYPHAFNLPNSLLIPALKSRWRDLIGIKRDWFNNYILNNDCFGTDSYCSYNIPHTLGKGYINPKNL